MPTPVSIRERILRQAESIADTVTSIGTVRRWDAAEEFTSNEASTDNSAPDAIVCVRDETRQRPADDSHPVLCEMNVQVAVTLFPSAAEGQTEAVIEKWRGRLKRAFLPKRFFVEDVSGVRLVTDSQIVESPGGEMDDGSVFASVTIHVVYQHDADDDSSFGSIITTLEE